MNKQQLISILLLGLLIGSCTAQLRFRDDEMMKEHHSHTNGNEHSDLLQASNNNDPLTVHLIPHSHDDIGWLKTVDSYYYGANMTIQYAGVQYTIDSYMGELLKDPSKKFIQVEIGFFYRWWNEQNDDMKNQVRQVIKNGQLEFINGGWCMNDQATPYYEDIIENMAIGHQFLYETFGIVPTVGWHIDPFGHSAAQASLFSQMGFDSFFFARIDYQDKQVRLSNKGMQMVWHPRSDSREDNSIFTHVNYYHYSAPPGFCFDMACTNDPIMDDPTLQYYNVDKKSDLFAQYFRNMSLHYRSQNLLHTLGEDFQYMNAPQYFQNIDKLINYINSHPEYNMKIQYSNVSEYIQEIHQEGNTYPTKYDDFFPYSDCPHCFWTGYFVSRTAIKGSVRLNGRYLISARTYLALLKIQNQSPFIQSNLNKVLHYIQAYEQVIGVLQHHDAVSGTEKQWVANDYVYMLHKARYDLEQNVLNPVLNQQTFTSIGETATNYTTCLWNATSAECGTTNLLLREGKTVLIAVYNPTGDRDYIVRLQVPNIEGLSVINTKNEQLEGDFMCTNKKNKEDCQLYFKAHLSSFALNFFKVIPSSSGTKIKVVAPKNLNKFLASKLALSASRSLKVTTKNKFVYSVCDSNGSNCQNNDFQLSYEYYRSFTKTAKDDQASGAYIFRPKQAKSYKTYVYSKTKSRRAFVGSVVTVVQLLGSDSETAVRFFDRPSTSSLNWDNVVQVETYLYGIQVKKFGKQVVMRVKSNINNKNTFYTDANGLELQQRVVDFRPTWVLQVEQKVSGNYYPINALITIEQKDTKKLSLVVDRSIGGTSLKDGVIQVMLNRATTDDDARGVGQPINEMEPNDPQQPLSQQLTTWIVFSDDQNLPDLPRQTQLHVDLYPLIYFAPAAEQLQTSFKENIIQSLIDNSQVPYMTQLYYQIWDVNNNYLFRIHNMNERVTSSYSLEGVNVVEQTLTANQNMADWQSKRLKWKDSNQTMSEDIRQEALRQSRITESLVFDSSISAQPMQIQTFTFTASD